MRFVRRAERSMRIGRQHEFSNILMPSSAFLFIPFDCVGPLEAAGDAKLLEEDCTEEEDWTEKVRDEVGDEEKSCGSTSTNVSGDEASSWYEKSLAEGSSLKVQLQSDGKLTSEDGVLVTLVAILLL